jgi:sulfur carrier protein ThiS
VVKVNGELVRKEDYGTALVPDGADVKVIHLISGGSGAWIPPSL